MGVNVSSGSLLQWPEEKVEIVKNLLIQITYWVKIKMLGVYARMIIPDSFFTPKTGEEEGWFSLKSSVIQSTVLSTLFYVNIKKFREWVKCYTSCSFLLTCLPMFGKRCKTASWGYFDEGDDRFSVMDLSYMIFFIDSF